MANGLSEQTDGRLKDVAAPNIDRSSFTVRDSIIYLLDGIGIPTEIAQLIELPGEGLGLPSSFKIAHLAQTSLALTGILASLHHSLRTGGELSKVSVLLQHAVIEFKSERLYSIDGKPAPLSWGPIGGLHRTADGYVRLHDSFPHHRDGAKKLLGCPDHATRADVGQKIASWNAVDLESAAFDANLVISALRSYHQWDVLPQAKAIADFPISITKIADGPVTLPRGSFTEATKALQGVKVLEMSRVIAAPLAGKTLAVHGADVLWITSPNLPDLPGIDREFARGKRTAHIDIKDPEQKANLLSLAAAADVFIQGYRPGSLASKGLDPESLAALSTNRIICANLSAYSPDGPWSGKRGFDSLVQTCSGMNVSEAEHYGESEVARPAPCQVLDHASGYFLAAGIMAALYMRATVGGSYLVDVSLAGVMKYLRSLGQFPGKSGFECDDITSLDQVPEEFTETKESGFGLMRSIKHSVRLDGVQVGWDIMPKPLGSDAAVWNP